MTRIPSAVSRTILLAAIGALGAGGTAIAGAPPIRLSDTNRVPACVTPARLDAYLEAEITRRGHRLATAHRSIAQWYRRHGESQRVRWDYAFFQMALETNFLSFHRGNGKRCPVGRPSYARFLCCLAERSADGSGSYPLTDRVRM